MRRTTGLLLASGVLALAVPAAMSGAASKFVRVAFPTLVSQQMQAAPGLCKDGAWQVLGKTHGDPFKTETQCVKYATRPAAVFGLPAYSYRRSWALLPAPFDPKVPQNTCTNLSSVACIVLFKGLQVPFGGKGHDFGVPEDPPDTQQAVSVSTSDMMLQGTTTSVDTSNCFASPGRFSYTASGRSLGPYPGTFTETGTITLGLGLLRRTITDVSIDLVVESDVGHVHMTYAHPAPPPNITGSGECFPGLGLRTAHFSAIMLYGATITRPDGTTFEDSGDSVATASYTSSALTTITSFESDAQSNRLPSNASLPPPTPVCPPEGCS